MKKQKLKELWKKLKDEALSHHSPHEISLGVGIGSFLGIFPVQGFKTPLVVLIAGLYKRANVVAILATSSILSLPFVFPFVYFFDYIVGCQILKIPTVLKLSSFKDFNFKMLGGSVGALFLGGGIVGLSLGLLSYGISLIFLRLRHGKG